MNFEHFDFETYDIFDPTQQGPLDPAIVALLDQVDWKAELPPADTTWPTGNMALAGQHPVIAPPQAVDDITGFLTADWQQDLDWLFSFDPTAKRRESNVIQEMGHSTDANLLRFQYGSVPAQVPVMMATPSPDAYGGVPNWTTGFSEFTSGEPSGSMVPSMHEQAHFAASDSGSSTTASTSALKSTSSNGKKRKRTAEPAEASQARKRKRRYWCLVIGCSHPFDHGLAKDRDRHMVSHFADTKWACKGCDYRTYRKDLLTNHLRTKRCSSKDGVSEKSLEGSTEPWLTEEGIKRVLRPDDDDRSPTAIKIRRLKDLKDARS